MEMDILLPPITKLQPISIQPPIYTMKLKSFLVHFLLINLFATVSTAVDTMTTADNLTDVDGAATIISSDGSFELGFFSPTPNSPYRYLGIRYAQISVPTYVWVANRDSPLTNRSVILRLTQQGILTLSDNTTLFWSSNSTGNSAPLPQNPVAQLLESGNLVIREAGDASYSSDNYLWQSFDYPVDTVLPGMKAGKNFRTGVDTDLWASNSDSDLSRGNYRYLTDTNGYPQKFLFNGSTIIYRIGPWNGIRSSGSTGFDTNTIFTPRFVVNQEEVYYTFELINKSVYSRLVLNPDGFLRRFVWNYNTRDWTRLLTVPQDNCDTYRLCGSYGTCNMNNSPACGCLDKFVPRFPNDWARADWSNGCVRNAILNCQDDGFNLYQGIKVPDSRWSWYDRNMTLPQCRERCLRDCNCTAYTNLDVRNGGSGCLMWFGDLVDIRQVSQNEQDVYIRVAASEVETTSIPSGSKEEKMKKVRIIAIVLSLVGLIGVMVALYLWYIKKSKKEEQQDQERHQPHEKHVQSCERTYTSESHNDDMELPLMSFEALAKATNDFSLEKKLGEGGFGPVYKGILDGGQEIAVKRLSKCSSQGLHEFKNEVSLIAKLQHRNLVKLLGCCIQGQEKMLVYEYMPNNSLGTYIFDENQRSLLDWPKRFNIISGIARGLLYLHQDCPLRIIHRDLKPSNVLLDIDLNPKISDFGMARSFGGHETEANTQKVVGTYGYMSPEYAVNGIFSVKSDAFSFGVLVLEIISGQRIRGFFHQEHHHNLLGHAWLLHNEGRPRELIDEKLVDSCHLSEILRSIHIALLCVQQNPEDRPSMSKVVVMLDGEGKLSQPKKPGFFTARDLFLGADYSSRSHAKISNNEVSITLLDGR